jgi:hypothetical protein|tara:strand:+ start:468 stop:731 length:264 start_codon:yes stop_codon:yes gene_type:complete
MKKFAAEQIKKFFETGQWALKLIFIVVLVELGIVTGALIGLAGPLDENDSNNIKHIMGMIATKSFALYAAEKASSKEKYLIEGVSKK